MLKFLGILGSSLVLACFYAGASAGIFDFLVFFLAMIVFGFMVMEDYKQQTIDMRNWVLLFLLFFALSGNYIGFLAHALLWYIAFRVVFLLSYRAVDDIPVKKLPENGGKYYTRSPRGYLPSLAASLLMILGYRYLIWDIPCVLEPTYQGFLYFSNMLMPYNYYLFAGAIVVGMAALCILEKRLQRQRLAGKIILYGFGDGDVFVLAVFAALLGAPLFSVVFFTSLLVQLIFYLYFVRQICKKTRNQGCY